MTSIHRILETCLNQGAIEAWLIPDRPPLLRFPDNVRELITGEVLSSFQIESLVFNGMAPNMKNSYRKHEFCAFDYPCEWRGNERVRVFVVRHGKATFATLTPLPHGTPELAYGADGPERAGQK